MCKTGTRPDFTNVPMQVAEAPAGILNYSFEGDAVGIAIAAGLDAGIVEYLPFLEKALQAKQRYNNLAKYPALQDLNLMPNSYLQL